MSSQTPTEKGNALEQAVRTIETAIIRAFPGYSESAFLIEGKKIFFASGVRHEVDVYVETTLGPGYDAVFIFECKNWLEKVGKNEIIIFSEKIRVTNAQRGFFVAKSYTADAEAQAKQDQRIELLLAAELDPSAVMVPGGFHAIYVGETSVVLEIRLAGASPGASRVPIDITKTLFVLDGECTDLKAYMDAWVERAKCARCDYFPSGLAEEGIHVLEFSDECNFSEGRAAVDGQAVSGVILKGSVQVHLSKAIVVSAFEVMSRGRVITVKVPGPAVQLKFEFVQLVNAGTAA
jgi:hypothetical protein